VGRFTYNIHVEKRREKRGRQFSRNTSGWREGKGNGNEEKKQKKKINKKGGGGNEIVVRKRKEKTAAYLTRKWEKKVRIGKGKEKRKREKRVLVDPQP